MSEMQPAINRILAKIAGLRLALVELGYVNGASTAVAEKPAAKSEVTGKKRGRPAAAKKAEEPAPAAGKRSQAREQLLKVIRKKGPIKSGRLADLLDKEQSNVIQTCAKLIELGLIRKNEDKEYEAIEQDTEENAEPKAKKEAPAKDDADDEGAEAAGAEDAQEFSDSELAELVQ